MTDKKTVIAQAICMWMKEDVKDEHRTNVKETLSYNRCIHGRSWMKLYDVALKPYRHISTYCHQILDDLTISHVLTIARTREINYILLLKTIVSINTIFNLKWLPPTAVVGSHWPLLISLCAIVRSQRATDCASIVRALLWCRNRVELITSCKVTQTKSR